MANFNKIFSLAMAVVALHTMLVMLVLQHYYSCLACGFAVLFGLMEFFMDNAGSLAHEIMLTLFKIASMPLINYDLYNKSCWRNYAEIHILFTTSITMVVFTCMYIILRKQGNQTPTLQFGEGCVTFTTVVSNIFATFYLGFIRENIMICFLGAIASANAYGSFIINDLYGGAGEPVAMIGYSLFFFMVQKCF